MSEISSMYGLSTEGFITGSPILAFSTHENKRMEGKMQTKLQALWSKICFSARSLLARLLKLVRDGLNNRHHTVTEGGGARHRNPANA